MVNSDYETEDSEMEYEEYESDEISQQSNPEVELSSNEITSTVPEPEDIYEASYPSYWPNQNNVYYYEEEDEVVEERVLLNNPVGYDRPPSNHPTHQIRAPYFHSNREMNALPPPEYAIPLVDLSIPGVQERLLHFGIQHYIHVRHLQNSNFRLPVVSVQNLQMGQISSYLFDVCDFLKVGPHNVHPMY